jgi:acetolactate synthase regulatory subunit
VKGVEQEPVVDLRAGKEPDPMKEALMKKPLTRIRMASPQLPIVRWLTIKFRESILTQKEMLILMRKFGGRICQLECSTAVEGLTLYIEVQCRSRRDLSRVVYALEQFPGVAVASFGDRIDREKAL